MASRGYHHGDLRRALLECAEQAVSDGGPAQLSLRDVARRAGVSHAAPAHHFGDKRGLLTALAAEGFAQLARRLEEALAERGAFLDVAVAYVDFAVDRRAPFEVMFRPDMYDALDPTVVQARAEAAGSLALGLASMPEDAVGADRRVAELAAWSLVHGFATLWLGGALTTDGRDDPGDTARAVARYLFDKGVGPAR